jgi:DHA2 family multidrug resistance protein
VPSVGMALNGFAMTELRYASALFNLMRNLGGAIGIAVVNTWLQDGARIETARLSEGLGETRSRAPDLIAGLAAQFQQAGGDAAQALLLAEGEFARIVGRQALTLAFDEVFRQMAWIFLAALAMVPFCRPAPNTSPAVEAH